MNKRFLTIAAALSMGVALTACSSGGGDEGKTGGWYYVKKKDS